jgi:hypothetical protein
LQLSHRIGQLWLKVEGIEIELAFDRFAFVDLVAWSTRVCPAGTMIV